MVGSSALKETLRLKEIEDILISLGSTLVLGKKKAMNFGKLKNMIQSKTKGWRKQLPSRAGKASLIKFMVQAITVYKMSIFTFPLGVYN